MEGGRAEGVVVMPKRALVDLGDSGRGWAGGWVGWLARKASNPSSIASLSLVLGGRSGVGWLSGAGCVRVLVSLYLSLSPFVRLPVCPFVCLFGFPLCCFLLFCLCVRVATPTFFPLELRNRPLPPDKCWALLLSR